MIIINCPMKQDYVQELVEGISAYHFTFVEKKGIKLLFETDCPNMDEAVALVKKTIKSTEIGSVLFFSVESK